MNNILLTIMEQGFPKKPHNLFETDVRFNDRFIRSNWLTFIKNRPGVTREFLRNDDMIFVQYDDNGACSLKVLMDKVFDNTFLNTIFVKVKGIKLFCT